MEITPQKIWEVLLEKFDENANFSSSFSKRKAWEKNRYNLDTENKETCIEVNYYKREGRLHLGIYFFEDRKGYEKLLSQKDRIKNEENVELIFEDRVSRTQYAFIKRFDIKPEGERKYIEELVEWIQDTALLLCYINEKYTLGKNVTRPVTKSKNIDIHEPMLPKTIIEDGNDYIVICGKCGEEFRKAKRCTFCGQILKWPGKDELSKYLIRRDGNKRQLLDMDDWATVTAFNEMSRQDALEIVNAFVRIGFDYHVGTSDLILNYKSDREDKGFCGIMLFGNGETAGIQPSELFTYAMSHGKGRKPVEDFLVDMIPYLSPNQKNKPYDNEKGYYYIGYQRLYSSLDDIISLYSKFIHEV